MARARRRRQTAPRNTAPRNAAAESTFNLPVNLPGTDSDTSLPADAEYTGRTLVVLRDGATEKDLKGLMSAGGLKSTCSSADFDNAALEIEQADSADVVYFDKLGVAVIKADPSQTSAMAASVASEAEDGVILAIEPERIMYALGAGGNVSVSGDYLRGYRDGIASLCESLGRQPAGEQIVGEGAEAAGFSDSSTATWGLQATRVVSSRASGRNVRVAVLDTGFDLAHPDFRGRAVVAQSFVAGQAVQDGHGHGTHCIGTSLGPASPTGVPRYGCAYAGQIFVGKVLNNVGRGADSGILAGINWAIQQRCRVISMSLGAPTNPGEPFPQTYETVARRALDLGTLIVAAAGNESQRSSGIIRPVGRPANCPSIMAVAALDQNLRVANFSNRGINPNGGQIDIAGPGVAVFSSWPMPRRYHTISGTSMATPHVAGIAAMRSQVTGATGRALWQQLVTSAQRLPLLSVDVGAGLVQAP